MSIYADRYRFSMEPDQLAVLQRSLLADLAHNASAKWRSLRRLVPDWRAITAAHDVFEDLESRATFRALLGYRYLTPHLSRVAHDRARAEGLEAFMQHDLPSRPVRTDRAVPQ